MSSDSLRCVSEDALAEILHQHNMRVTPQRRAILQVFQGRRDEHLSADEVYSRASAIVPELGRGTVYATLAEFSELGVLASVGHPEPVRYETNIDPHDHFHCRLCQRLFDVDLGGGGILRRPLDGYELETVSVRGQGTCAECRDYERGVIAGAARVKRRPTIDARAAAELSCVTVPSPVGKLALAASRDGVARVAFEDHADFEVLDERAHSRRGSVAGRRRCTDLGTTLENYFGGFRGRAQDVIDWRFAPEAIALVLTAVIEIPYGEPLSYDRLGGKLSAYECGQAMGSNPLPLIVPCHRVSCGSRLLDAYVGGAERLRFVRELEAG